MDFRAAFSNMKKGIPMKRKKWNDVWYYDKSKKILMNRKQLTENNYSHLAKR